MKKKALMYCCSSEKHSGQLVRAAELATRLTETFDVTILLDDEVLPDDVHIPGEVRIVRLPPLDVDPDSNVFEFARSSESRYNVVARRDVMLEEFDALKPRVVIVENFPFNQHRLRGEILPLIERARNGLYGESLVVCTTDGIMVDDSIRSEDRADGAADLLDKYFDMVIVESDPVFARLEEFFQPAETPQTPVYHTGFISPPSRAVWAEEEKRLDTILVSASNGRHGGRLYTAAIEAHEVLWPRLGLFMKIVAGSQFPDNEWVELSRQARGVAGLELVRIVPDIRREMARASWSVSQCGYNTAMHAITTRTPSLFVPCKERERREQFVRAQRLVYWGAGRLLTPFHLNGASLANEINQLLQMKPRAIRFDLDGATNAANLIVRTVYNNEYLTTAATTLSPGDGKPPH